MLEEIRFRRGQPVEIITNEGSIFLRQRIEGTDIRRVMNRLMGYSVAAYERELQQGFFTIPGGHRIGVVGRIHHDLQRMTDISGMNIRIAHECIGCATEIVQHLTREDGIYNTLFISSPGVGKTTYLRDAIRLISNSGRKVGVVDERSEIGASFRGECQNDLGSCTDLLDCCAKAEGMRMLLRTMSPEVIAVDEIAGEEETEIIHQMVHSGVALLGTVHASNLCEFMKRRDMNWLIEKQCIQRIVMIERTDEGRRYRIYDAENNRYMPCIGQHSWYVGEKTMPYFLENALDESAYRDEPSFSFQL